MSSPRSATFKFWVLAALVLPASAAGVAALWPALLSSARHQSSVLTSDGRSGGGEAAADYTLATWLDPGNRTAFAGLATTQIASGHPLQAIASLSRAGEGPAVNRLRVRTLLELGHSADAASAADALAVPGAPDSDLVLASFAYAVAGRTSDITALEGRVTSPEALTSVRRARSGNLTLAAELSATGLLNSSSALLNNLPASYQRNLLLARIAYTRHTKGSLAQAQRLLTAALALNPAAIPARRLLADVYSDQGDDQSATAQTALIAKLQSGRP